MDYSATELKPILKVAAKRQVAAQARDVKKKARYTQEIQAYLRDFLITLSKAIYRPNYFLPTIWSKGWENRLRSCRCIQGVCEHRTKNCKLNKSVGRQLLLQAEHLDQMEV